MSVAFGDWAVGVEVGVLLESFVDGRRCVFGRLSFFVGLLISLEVKSSVRAFV